MSKAVAVIPAEASIVEAARLMRTLDVGALPVTDGVRTIGIVTDRDLVLRAVANGLSPSSTCVCDTITPNVCTVDVDCDVAEAGELMAEAQVRRLVVVDEHHAAVGILSLGDLYRHHAASAGETALEGVT